MTKKEMFTAIREAVIDTPEFVEFLDNQIAALDKSRKPSKAVLAKQEANEALRQQIVEFLKTVDVATTKDIISAIDPELSTQKVTAVISPLVNDGIVLADRNKKKRIYTLAEKVEAKEAEAIEEFEETTDEAEDEEVA